jgi:hypothetical protein
MGIGAGANLVGGLMQSIAASKAQQEMGDAFLREMQQQQKFRNQAFGTFQEAVPQRGVETAQDQIAQGAQHRQDVYAQNTSPLGFGAGPTARDQAATGIAGALRGKLGGYSDWSLNQAISNIRTQDELNRITQQAGGQAQIFPYKMYDAQHSADQLAFWGSLISSIGSGAGSFLPSGGPPVGGGAGQYGSAFGGQGSPGNTGFGVPEGFASQFEGYA